MAKVGKMRKKEKPMRFTPEMLDELLKEYKKPEDLMDEQGLLKQLCPCSKTAQS
jgi:hypothetical protein